MVIASTSSPFHVNNFNPFGQTSNSSSTPLFGASTLFAQNSSSFPGFQGTTTFGQIGSTEPNGNQRRGSAVAPYSTTTEVNPNNNSSTLKINSISAMPIYTDKSQEELRFEDYQSGIKGYTVSIQNQRNAFQPFNSQFGPSTVPVPSSQFTFGSTPASDFSAKSLFPSNGTVFGVSTPFGSGSSIGNNSSVDKARIASSSIFGVPNVPTFGPGNGSSGFKTSIFGVPSTSVSEPSSTPGFGISSTTSLWSTSASVSSTTYGPSSTFATGISSNLFNSSPLSPQSQAFAPQSTFSSTYRNPFLPQTQQAFSSHTTFSSTYRNPFLPQSQQAFSSHTTPNSTYRNPFVPQSQAFSPHTTPKNTALNPFPSQSQEFSFHATPKSTSLNTFPPQSQAFSSHSTPNSTSVNPLFPQSQAFSPHTTLVSSMPTDTQNMYMFPTVPLHVSMPTNNCQCHAISTTSTDPSVGTSSLSKPLFTFPPSIQSTPVTGFGPLSSIPNASQTAEKQISFSTINLSQPSQASSGLTTVTEAGSQNITGQQNATTTTVSMQSSLVANPFPTRCALEISSGQPDAVTAIQHGISRLSVPNDSSREARTSLMRIRHVSLRRKRLPAQRHNYQNINPKVPFFIDKEDQPCLVSPFLPRENPRACFTNSLSKQDHIAPPTFTDSKDTSIQTDDSSINKKHDDDDDDDVLAVMPKLPDGEYYSEPSIQELIQNERSKPGYLSHVNHFVVGRQGYGSIKFLGETDIRGLDIASIVQFKNREVIVYVDDKKKPSIGQSLNKPAEVTLLNVKCISKKTGKQYVDGPQVESYKEKLIKKCDEQGAEFVSYDPVRGEWKFRVQHF